MGVKRIWGLIGAFAGKRAANISNTNDLCSEELKRLQDELVREDVKPIPHDSIRKCGAGRWLNLSRNQEERVPDRKERSAMDCVIALASDILEGFTEGKGTVAVALDIKGAFNALLPAEVGISIENETIPNTPTLFYLGVILDSKLTWEPHIRYIEGKASQSLNVLRTLAKVTYGADPGSMLMVYKGFPWALLEWGSILIAGANKTTLRRLDKVQNSALRIAMGCMRTTPIPILLSEAAYFDQDWVNVVYDVEPFFDTEIGYEVRMADSPELVLDGFLDREFQGYVVIYTDGSYLESGSRSGAGIFIPSLGYRQGTKLTDCYSALSAELNAILLALKCIETMGIYRATDRLSLSDKIIFDIVDEIRTKVMRGGDIRLVWIPSHSQISGNNEADRLAKMSGNFLAGVKSKPNRIDIKKMIDRDFEATKKREWPFFPIERTRQKYFEYINEKTERPWFRGYDLPRSTVNLITRMRTGHVCTGEQFLRMNWNISPECKCGAEISSLRHYVFECDLFEEGRDAFRNFVSRKFKSTPMTDTQWDSLIYNPNMQVVTEIGRFLRVEGIII
ncbi:uncharacterized protein LOC127277858 [Leptopilina boulardi]|uniref:uncharacterized protein LOC127277858 n=1 Tax=Leptopilina boulardi TaxID=63433 RepID=UPI0021F5E665|nr:uncharacterized protein LOC127277858 [Leptopilina boulardi]